MKEKYTHQGLLFQGLMKNAFGLIGINIIRDSLELKTKNGKIFSIPVKNVVTHWSLKNKKVTELLSTKQGRKKFLDDYNRSLYAIVPNCK